jgi:DNA-3-methyladenine glycosylase I
MTYCSIAPSDPYHAPYHDTEYGFPVRDDNVLFERLMLEINQAGLSWLTILKKREGFTRAYDGFDIARVAEYDDRDRARLIADPGIIRNRLKIDAAIENARRIVEIRGTHGSFADWLAHHHPLGRAEWAKLFRRTFRFTGGEIVGEFLMSIGYLPGAHEPTCPVYDRVVAAHPPWVEASGTERGNIATP